MKREWHHWHEHELEHDSRWLRSVANMTHGDATSSSRFAAFLHHLILPLIEHLNLSSSPPHVYVAAL